LLIAGEVRLQVYIGPEIEDGLADRLCAYVFYQAEVREHMLAFCEKTWKGVEKHLEFRAGRQVGDIFQIACH
jgi:hypothetical protein